MFFNNLEYFNLECLVFSELKIWKNEYFSRENRIKSGIIRDIVFVIGWGFWKLLFLWELFFFCSFLLLVVGGYFFS